MFSNPYIGGKTGPSLPWPVILVSFDESVGISLAEDGEEFAIRLNFLVYFIHSIKTIFIGAKKPPDIVVQNKDNKGAKSIVGGLTILSNMCEMFETILTSN